MSRSVDGRDVRHGAQPGFEYHVEDATGWTLDRESGEWTEWVGIRIGWRPAGERFWRKLVLVPDASIGQTVESLKADAEAIVEAQMEAERG